MVLTRERLIEDVWGYDYVGDTNVVDVYEVKLIMILKRILYYNKRCRLCY
ncbi:helix-turn-helix domain-containing protein [Clostridium botulinum]|nr:helix-turn-helix domain-containing protein [Clostridium botulinum]MCS4469139.1 helix-turn-helix domain-containing protein [Clostridium botulinum]MCS4478293.1 helix-turn-helix domain-containing protein [Clostridium botulinum]MCS4517494.1 helix-turn-helix domain-containing protein [Clostridium botulinum]MCS4522484.1 helix-turn-helix domain-containing protein [Clostridium botulinum]